MSKFSSLLKVNSTTELFKTSAPIDTVIQYKNSFYKSNQFISETDTLSTINKTLLFSSYNGEYVTDCHNAPFGFSSTYDSGFINAPNTDSGWYLFRQPSVSGTMSTLQAISRTINPTIFQKNEYSIGNWSEWFEFIQKDTNGILRSNLFVFENNTNIGNIATNYSFNPSTKINRATVTNNVVITLPTYSSNQSVSVMLKITQGGAGGYDITFQNAINLSQFDFTEGTEGQRTWVTLLWDGEEWCFTASAWQDAI